MNNDLEKIAKELLDKTAFSLPSNTTRGYEKILEAYYTYISVYGYDPTLTSKISKYYNWDELDFNTKATLKEFNGDINFVTFEGSDVEKFAENATKKTLVYIKRALYRHDVNTNEVKWAKVLEDFKNAGGEVGFKNTLLAMLANRRHLQRVNENGKIYTVVYLWPFLMGLKALLK